MTFEFFFFNHNIRIILKCKNLHSLVILRIRSNSLFYISLLSGIDNTWQKQLFVSILEIHLDSNVH